MKIRTQDLPDVVRDHFRAGYQVMHLVGEESHRYLKAIQKAAADLTKANEDRGVGGKVQVFCHDKVCGFYQAQPTLIPDAQLGKPLNAWLYMLGSSEMLKQAKLPSSLEEFDPEQAAIFVLKDWEVDLFQAPDGPKIVQNIRNMIHSNMGSDSYFGKAKGQKRGKRMLVFVSSTDKLPPTLPELKPIHIPLPDVESLRATVDRVADPVQRNYETTKNKTNAADRRGFAVPEQARVLLADSLRGLTDQGAEDALAMSFAKHKGLDDIDAILDTIEGQKAVQIAGIPGLTYYSKDMIQDIEMPGYEPLITFVRNRIQADPKKAKHHNLKLLQGLTLIAGPGLGKTRMSMLMAKITGRFLLFWNIGESKGGVVGQSEQQTRRAINVAQALRALVVLDDIDKGSLGQGSGNSTGDSGTTDNMVNMLLTEMSAKDNEALWMFTLNRVQNIKPELIRPGRVDGVFYIQRPDEYTRFLQAKVHIGYRKFELNAKDEAQLREIAAEQMREWTPAEIEGAIQNEAFATLADDKPKLNLDRLAKYCSVFTPMAKQPAFIEDFEAMELMAQQFIKIGRVPDPDATEFKPEGGDGRASRSIID